MALNVYSWFQSSFSPVKKEFVVKYNKPSGRGQAILKLRKQEKSIKAITQTLDIGNTRILNVLKNDRNHWSAEQKTLNRSAKDNNSS